MHVFLLALTVATVGYLTTTPALALTGLGVALFILHTATVRWLNENGHTK